MLPTDYYSLNIAAKHEYIKCIEYLVTFRGEGNPVDVHGWCCRYLIIVNA